ncbi:MAG TPA: TonB-dependent receptor, partial [Sphingomonas sp.]
GGDQTDASNFVLDEIRDRPTDIKNRFQTGKLDFEWNVAKGFTVKFGGFYRGFQFHYISGKRDTTACPTVGAPPIFGPGGFTCTSKTDGYSLASFPIGSDLISLGDNGQPAGTSDQFIVADLASATAFSGLYSRDGGPGTDPTNNRSVSERDKGGYLQFDARGDLFGLDYAMNGGVRYVATGTRSTALQAVQDSSGKVTGYAPLTVPGHYDNWLPSINVNFFPRHDLILRLAAAQTMTRPSLPSLSPNASVDQFNFKISFGNPNLLPAVATNYDAAIEWYFAPQSLFAVGAFSKNVQNGTQSVTTSGTFASSGLPTSILTAGTPGYNAVTSGTGDVWTITSIRNAPTVSNIKGLEFTFQSPFRFLPGFLSHFGVLANLTLTDSHSTNTVTGPAAATYPGIPGTTTTSAQAGGLTNPTHPLPSVTVVSAYQGASKTLYSATLYYEDAKFGARVSYSYRGPYLDNTGGSNGNINDGFAAYRTVDASMRYSITPNIDLTLDGVNLFDEYVYHYTDYQAQRNYEYYHTGRTLVFGARFKF